MVKHLLLALNLTTASLFASSSLVAEIDPATVKKIGKDAEIFEAEMTSYRKVYMSQGVEYKLTDAQLRKLSWKAYAQVSNSLAYIRTVYGGLRVYHIIDLKVTKSIKGKLEVGDHKQFMVSDHIDSMCPHFGSYEAKFSKKPKLIWMFYWQMAEEGTQKLSHAIATPKQWAALKLK